MKPKLGKRITMSAYFAALAVAAIVLLSISVSAAHADGGGATSLSTQVEPPPPRGVFPDEVGVEPPPPRGVFPDKVGVEPPPPRELAPDIAGSLNSLPKLGLSPASFFTAIGPSVIGELDQQMDMPEETLHNPTPEEVFAREFGAVCGIEAFLAYKQAIREGFSKRQALIIGIFAGQRCLQNSELPGDNILDETWDGSSLSFSK